MFERFTEKARRVIFFSRYEASQFGSTTIESEHMLLGLLREDRPMVDSLLPPSESANDIGREVAEHSVVKEKVSTSIDLPLAQDCKKALAYAAEEAERLLHGSISTAHLLLGLLRVETCVAAKILKGHGLDLAQIRETLATKNFEASQNDARLRTLLSAAPVFRVVSVARSVEWYRDALGFDADPFGDPADPSFASLNRDGVEIMLQKVSREAGESRSATKAGGGWDAYIRILHIHGFRASIQSKLNTEIAIRETEYGCSELTVVDPDGHVLVFGECR